MHMNIELGIWFGVVQFLISKGTFNSNFFILLLFHRTINLNLNMFYLNLQNLWFQKLPKNLDLVQVKNQFSSICITPNKNKCTHTHEEWDINVGESWRGFSEKNKISITNETRHETLIFWPIWKRIGQFFKKGGCIKKRLDACMFKELKFFLQGQ